MAFAIHFRLRDFQASLDSLLTFGEFLARSVKAHKSITNAFASIKSFHLQHGFDTEVFDNFKLTLWKRALPLTHRHEPAPASALPVELLRDLCGEAVGFGPEGLAVAALLATAFYSLARLSLLVPITGASADATRIPLRRDLRFRGEGACLYIKWGKAAQEPEQGYWVPLRATRQLFCCPVQLLRNLVGSRPLASQDAPLFSFPSRTQGSADPYLTQESARRWLRRLLARLGLPNDAFTFHSFRRGGCTSAFVQGAATTDVQHLGGWRSRAVDSYLPLFEARDRAARLLAAATYTPSSSPNVRWTECI